MARGLAIVIVILALVDGLVHLSIDLFLMHSFTRSFVNVLFALNFVGYVVLIVGFLYASNAQSALRRLVDIGLIVYPLLTLAAWLYFTKGRGNPMGLAEISKPAEVILAVAALLHLTRFGQGESVQPQLARGH